MMRKASEDTVLNIPNPHGQEGSYSLPVAKGTWVATDVIGIREFSSLSGTPFTENWNLCGRIQPEVFRRA